MQYIYIYVVVKESVCVCIYTTVIFPEGKKTTIFCDNHKNKLYRLFQRENQIPNGNIVDALVYSCCLDGGGDKNGFRKFVGVLVSVWRQSRLQISKGLVPKTDNGLSKIASQTHINFSFFIRGITFYTYIHSGFPRNIQERERYIFKAIFVREI